MHRAQDRPCAATHRLAEALVGGGESVHERQVRLIGKLRRLGQVLRHVVRAVRRRVVADVAVEDAVEAVALRELQTGRRERVRSKPSGV